MTAHRIIELFTVLFVLGVGATLAIGDGKVFHPIGTTEPGRMPDQRALLAFDGSTETLVIDTRFTGPAGEAAWLVPLPAEPIIEPATDGLFPTLEAIFATRVRHHVSTPGVAILVLVLVVLVIGLLARTVGWFTVVTLVLMGTCIVPLGLPSLGKARSSSSGIPGVVVLDRQLVGVYDTAVLSGDDPAAVFGWLETNGFAAPAGVEPVIAEYLASGWVFAAAKVSAPSGRPAAGPRTPHPLAFTFETDEPVYPVRLTGVGNGELLVDLYVFADGRARAPGWRTGMSLPTDYPVAEPYFQARPMRALDEPIIVTHRELLRYVGPRTTATHLTATLTEREMLEDVRLAITPSEAHVPRIYTRKAAGLIGMQIMLWAMLVSLGVVHAVRFTRDWPTGRALKVSVAALVGCVVFVPLTHLVLAEVPDDSIVGARSIRRATDLQMGVWGDLWDEFNELERDAFTLAEVESRAEEIMEARAAERNEPLRFIQDSPGNAVVRERSDGTIEYYAHDRVGTPLLIGYVWEPADNDPAGP